MSTILFVMEIAAFLLVAYWAYENDKIRSSMSSKGLLKMKPDPVASPSAPKTRGPKWKEAAIRGQYGDVGADTRQTKTNHSKPRWARSRTR